MNVISFESLRKIKTQKEQENLYKVKLQTMQKFEVLCDLLKYDEIIRRNPTDMQAAIRAQFIMESLEKRAELNELREFAIQYRRKLATQIYSQVQAVVS